MSSFVDRYTKNVHLLEDEILVSQLHTSLTINENQMTPDKYVDTYCTAENTVSYIITF